MTTSAETNAGSMNPVSYTKVRQRDGPWRHSRCNRQLHITDHYIMKKKKTRKKRRMHDDDEEETVFCNRLKAKAKTKSFLNIHYHCVHYNVCLNSHCTCCVPAMNFLDNTRLNMYFTGGNSPMKANTGVTI